MGGMLERLKRRWVIVSAAACVLLLALWTAHAADVRADRKAEGRTLCERSIRSELLAGYDPEIEVFFYEINPDRAFLYDAYADDGDGDWACKITWDSGRPEVTISNGTYRASDEKNGWP